MKKSELRKLIRDLVEEAYKPNVGIDATMLNEVIKNLTKVKEGKIDLRETLTPAQFDEFNKALNKVYTTMMK